MFGELTNGGGGSSSDKPSNGDLKKPPPPKPPISHNGSQSDLIGSKTEEAKKPSWLEELNRKQIQRRSGMFGKDSNNATGSKESPVTSPTSVPTTTTVAPVATAPAGPPPVLEAKPSIPVKPAKPTSQIIKQEEGKRKITFLKNAILFLKY